MAIPNRQTLRRNLKHLRRAWIDVGQTARSRITGTVRPDLPVEDHDLIRRQIDSCLSDSGGAASARARAANLGGVYLGLNQEGRSSFLRLLARDYGVDQKTLQLAVEKWIQTTQRPDEVAKIDRADLEAEEALRKTLLSPRIRLLTRFNELPEGAKFLVDMRAELISLRGQDAELRAFDREVRDLLASWFDVGFLELRRITWDAPATLLERLASHEAVHAIRSWQDIKHRLAASDRRCYAFIHPQMPNDPLIFVWVALTQGLSDKIQDLLKIEDFEVDLGKADTAVFYSISATQPGLDGVGFGSFLIKRVVDRLSRDHKQLKVFSTLSPIPGFRSWLEQQHAALRSNSEVHPQILSLLRNINREDAERIFSDRSWVRDEVATTKLRQPLSALCAYYVVHEKQGSSAHDRVAHFHLSNGANVERLNWLGDVSKKGQAESACLMINYRYRQKEIESNHENYHTDGKISCSKAVNALVQS